MSLRDKRTGRVRKGTHDKVRPTKAHESRRVPRRLHDRGIIEDVLKEWAEDYEGNHDIFA